MGSSASTKISEQVQDHKSGQINGLLGLAAQAAHKDIEPAVFLERAREAFQKFDEAFASLKNSINSEAEGSGVKFYGDMLLDDIDDIAELMHLGLASFEEFGKSWNNLDLRVGVQLMQKGTERFNDLTAKTQAVAENNELYDSKDVVCAAGSEVMRKHLKPEEFPAAMNQLREVFDFYLDNFNISRESVFTAAKSLLNFEEDPERLHSEALKVLAELQSLENDCAALILSAHNPEYVKRSALETVSRGITEV